MKVIDLLNRTIFVDDIIQIYIEENYNPERYNIQTTNGTYIVSREEYFKVRDYLLSLNDEVEIIEEDKKIEKIPYMFNMGYIDINKDIVREELNETINGIYNKINEIIEVLNERDI